MLQKNTLILDFCDFIVEEIEELEDEDAQRLDQSSSSTRNDPIYEVQIDDCGKRSYEFEGEPTKKLKSNPDFNENSLVFQSVPFKPVSSVDVAFPHACVECQLSTYAFACQPCGHLCLCKPCSKNTVQKNCPMCAKKVLWVQEIIPVTPFDANFKVEMIQAEVR